MLDLYTLQIFLVAAETENFSETGRRLNLSQPSVSLQIRGLETYLGTELFDRSGRHIVLTEAGQALVPLASQLVGHAIQVEEAMASLHGEVVGLLKVGCSTTVGKYVLPKLLARLRDRHPLVQVTCHVTTRSLALQMLIDGDVHVALTSLREPYKDIEYRPFLTDQIVLVMSPEHPWALTGKAVQPSDLLTQKFIVREESSGTNASLKDGLSWHNLSLDDLNIVMTLGNSEAICMAVQEGIGGAFVSCMVVADAIRSGALVSVEVEGLTLQKNLYMANHTGRPATRAQSAFWDLAFSPESESIRQLPNRGMILQD
jgi:DNA-binding transcriptional LysR family regulator